MARESQVTRKSLRMAACAAMLGLACGFSTGCVTTEGERLGKGTCAKPTNSKTTACQIMTRWHPEVAYLPDPTRNGAPVPGIVGRVSLLTAQMDYPVEADGSFHVEMFDATAAEPKILEKWDLDPATLRKFQKRDVLGVGYSLFLPWSSYRKDLARVQMRLSYQPAKGGAPLYSSTSTVYLGGTRPVVSTSAYTTGPDGARPIPGNPSVQTPPSQNVGSRDPRPATFTTVR